MDQARHDEVNKLLCTLTRKERDVLRLTCQGIDAKLDFIQRPR
jgi:hypothetical protein